MDNNRLETRVKELERKIDAITNAVQVPSTATLADVIIVLNKITNSIKRR